MANGGGRADGTMRQGRYSGRALEILIPERMRENISESIHLQRGCVCEGWVCRVFDVVLVLGVEEAVWV